MDITDEMIIDARVAAELAKEKRLRPSECMRAALAAVAPTIAAAEREALARIADDRAKFQKTQGCASREAEAETIAAAIRARSD